MGIYCEEHRNTRGAHTLKVHDEVLCVTTQGDENITAVCRRVVNAIPKNARSRDLFEGSVNIHIGNADPLETSPGELSINSLRLGERRFSITRATAQRYLPQTMQLY
jgi:hypothetical protein